MRVCLLPLAMLFLLHAFTAVAAAESESIFSKREAELIAEIASIDRRIEALEKKAATLGTTPVQPPSCFSCSSERPKNPDKTKASLGHDIAELRGKREKAKKALEALRVEQIALLKTKHTDAVSALARLEEAAERNMKALRSVMEKSKRLQQIAEAMQVENSEFRVVCERRVHELEKLVGKQEHDQVEAMRRENPKAHLFYHVLSCKMLNIFSTYLWLSTEKIAFALDRTSMAANAANQAATTIPVVGPAVGAVLGSTIIYAKGRQRFGRSVRVSEVLGNPEIASRIVCLVALALTKKHAKELESRDEKGIVREAERVEKLVQHIVTKGEVVLPLNEQPDEIASEIIRLYEETRVRH